MIYTALGDSITFGENASSCAKAYPQLAVSQLNSSSCRVTGYVIARPGWSSADLLDAVKWQVVPIISKSAIVSIWIGGVDLLNAALLSLNNEEPLAAKPFVTSYGRNLEAILTLIKREGHARIICCTQYNPFPNSSLAVEAIGQLNRMTKEVAHCCGVNIAPIHTLFEGKQADLIYGYRKGKIEDALSGSLPIHPNDWGHRVIAKGLTPHLVPHKSSR